MVVFMITTAGGVNYAPYTCVLVVREESIRNHEAYCTKNWNKKKNPRKDK